MYQKEYYRIKLEIHRKNGVTIKAADKKKQSLLIETKRNGMRRKEVEKTRKMDN